MGFCLFREAGSVSRYFAVNVAHITDLEPQDGHGEPVCLLKLEGQAPAFQPLACGSIEAIQKLLMDASKIGLGKVEAEILTGRERLKATPLLVNNTERLMIVRELTHDEMDQYESNCTTISEMIFVDGTSRLISGRPGTFSMRVNAGGKVPIGS